MIYFPMQKTTFKIIILILVLFLGLQGLFSEEISVYFFHQPGCENCARMEEHLHDLKESFPEMKIIPLNLEIDMIANIQYEIAVRQFKIQSTAVPLVMIGEYYWTGARAQVLEDIALKISQYQVRPYEDLVGKVINGEISDTSKITTPTLDTISLPLFGEIQLGKLSLAASTTLIALIDGFNPCSLWVLTLVLGMALHAKKRLKILAVGVLFLLITSLIYGGFLFGAVKVVGILQFSGLLRLLLILFIAFFAVINIKDYFKWKEGLSLTIGEKGKGNFLEKLRIWMNPSRGMLPLLLGTIVLAVSAALIELPCTAGFPLLWAQILAGYEISQTGLYAYLALYLLVYLLDEIIVLLIVVITLRRQIMDESKGRVLKLVSGSLMASLAFHLVLLPNFMGSAPGLLTVMGLTGLIIGIMVLIRKRSPSK
jgi:thiol-disulfide isomerase/thioredoxin